MLLGIPRNRLTRCLGGIALAAFVVVACREATAPTSLNLLMISSEGSLRAPDYWWVAVRGLQPRTEIRDTVGESGDTILFDGLKPGVYAVALVGFVDSVVDQFGLMRVSVEAGESNQAVVSPHMFKPLFSVTSDQQCLKQTVKWGIVEDATGYVVEWGKDSLFTETDSTTLPQATIQFGNAGRYGIRVRAFHHDYVAVESAPSDTLSVAVCLRAPTPALKFTVEPTDILVDAVMPAVQVKLHDTTGDTLLTDPTLVTIALTPDTSLPGVLQGTDTATTVDGVAIFDRLSIDAAGMGYTLLATADSASPATSAAFDVSDAVTPALTFTVEPTDVLVDAVIMPAIKVELRDTTADTLLTDVTPVTIAILHNRGGQGTLLGTPTVNTVNGVVTFDDLSITAVGVGYTLEVTAPGAIPATSAAFDVSDPVTPALTFTVEPSHTPVNSVIMPAVQVELRDTTADTLLTDVTPVTIAILHNPGNGTLHDTLTVDAVGGSASFNLSIDAAGVGYTLKVTAPGAVPAISDSFDVFVPTLAFLGSASDAQVDSVITPTVQVEFQDPDGHRLTNMTGDVSLALIDGTAGASLSGTPTIPAKDGVASFSDISIDSAAFGYRLVATATGANATPDTSDVFEVFVPTLAFTVPPSEVQAGSVMMPAVLVEFQYPKGNRLTNMTGTVKLSVVTGPSDSLLGTTTVDAVNGVATFDDLSLDEPGGYRLIAKSGALDTGPSAEFQVTVLACSPSPLGQARLGGCPVPDDDDDEEDDDES